MASGLAIHIVAGLAKHTEVLMQNRIRVGTGADCELRLQPLSPAHETADASGAMLELTRTNGSYHVTAFNSSLDITHNNAPLEAQAEIDDGDEIRIGSADVALQFFPVSSLPATIKDRRYEPHVAPFIEHAAIESAATARRDDAKVFLREFTRELVREIKLSTKLITLAIAISLVGGLLYIGFALYKEVQFSRRLINDQKNQIAQMQESVGSTNQKLGEVTRTNNDIIGSMSLVPKLRSDYGNGVCLISGSFIFVEPGTNRPLRYREPSQNEDAEAQAAMNGAPQLTAEGKGAVAEFEFVGTGFHVGDGYVLTNRHVAQPWLAGDQRVQSLSSDVKARPRLKRLMAFFPEHSQAIPLHFKEAAQRDDLAVCVIEDKDSLAGIPVLPLDGDSDAIAIGREVVLIGYPSGPDRLLARLDETEARGIQTRCGASLQSLLGCLSDKKYIQPLTTRGHITDLNARRIVYDASTAEGGSGAPLFGQSGRVIGINFAIFVENSASNFAVPVRYGIMLLQRAGMKIAEASGENKNANANSNTNTQRNASSAPAANANH
ncbi:MAG: trypsin-like peptidase domain-containing protein [Pyrinomonadaceae bacterium]